MVFKYYWFACFLFWFIDGLENIHADQMCRNTEAKGGFGSSKTSFSNTLLKQSIADRSKEVILLGYI